MKSLFTVFLILFFSIGVNAQEWQALESGSGVTLRALYFPTPDTGFVVGNAGTILRTINAGASWSALSSGINQDLNDVHFMNKNVGWTCGDDGTILKTSNGGTTWIVQSVVSSDLQSIFFTGLLTGYVVGDNGSAFSTSDGGNIWDEMEIGTNTNKFSIFYADNANGYIAGVGSADAIIKTENANDSWISTFDGTGQTFGAIHFTDSNVGYAVTQNTGTVFKTENAGDTWQNLNVNNSGGLFGIYFSSTQAGYAVGGFPNNSSILFTNDEGATWSAQNSSSQSPLFDVFFVNDSVGYAVGMNGTIVKTNNGNIVGYDENILEESLVLFPNPTRDFLNIRCNAPGGTIKLIITDIVGMPVLEQTVKSQSKVDISSLPTGVYLLDVNNGLSSTVRRIIKQ